MTDQVEADKQAELDAALELTPATAEAAPAAEKTEAPAEPMTKAERKAAAKAAKEAEAGEQKTEKTEAPAKAAKVEVKDENGNVRYRRMAPTTESAPAKPKTKPRVPVKDRSRITKTNKDGISHNSTHLQFPTDRWGLTKDLKKALIDVASRMAGDPVKREMVDEVLRIGLGHIEAKFVGDNAQRVARQDAAKEAAQ